jgi:hypothetical protein
MGGRTGGRTTGGRKEGTKEGYQGRNKGRREQRKMKEGGKEGPTCGRSRNGHVGSTEFGQQSFRFFSSPVPHHEMATRAKILGL